MTESDRQRQLAHVRECLALCDRQFSPEDIADAEFVLRQPLRARDVVQQEIRLSFE